jgi:chromosome partitioning protein
MGFVIGLINQKGGAGKSALAQLIASGYALLSDPWNVKIADLDPQGTSVDWCTERNRHSQEPYIAVQSYARVEDALKEADLYDLIILDTQGDRDSRPTGKTLRTAKVCDAIVIPTRPNYPDFRIAAKTALLLQDHGIDPFKIIIVINQSTGDNLVLEGQDYFKGAGFYVCEGHLPLRDTYARALGYGLSPLEVHVSSLRDKAQTVFQSIDSRIAAIIERSST